MTNKTNSIVLNDVAANYYRELVAATEKANEQQREIAARAEEALKPFQDELDAIHKGFEPIHRTAWDNIIEAQGLDKSKAWSIDSEAFERHGIVIVHEDENPLRKLMGNLRDLKERAEQGEDIGLRDFLGALSGATGDGGSVAVAGPGGVFPLGGENGRSFEDAVRSALGGEPDSLDTLGASLEAEEQEGRLN